MQSSIGSEAVKLISTRTFKGLMAGAVAGRSPIPRSSAEQKEIAGLTRAVVDERVALRERVKELIFEVECGWNRARQSA